MEIRTKYFGFAKNLDDSSRISEELNGVSCGEKYFFSDGKIIKTLSLNGFHNIGDDLVNKIHDVFIKNDCKFAYTWVCDEQGGGYCYYGENNSHSVKLDIDSEALLSLKSKTFVEFLIFCGLSEYLDDVLFGR